MTAVTAPTRISKAMGLRRGVAVWAPLVAGLLIVAAFFLDPAIDADGRELAKAYAENPVPTQWAATSLRIGYALLIVPVFVLIFAIRERGAGWANLAMVFAVLGMTTLPGFLLTDYFDLAIYGQLGGDAWQQVNDRLQELPGVMFMQITALLGFLLALPTTLLAAWRAGVLPWWPAVAMLVGGLAAPAVPGGIGLLILAAILGAISFALNRAELSWA